MYLLTRYLLKWIFLFYEKSKNSYFLIISLLPLSKIVIYLFLNVRKNFSTLNQSKEESLIFFYLFFQECRIQQINNFSNICLNSLFTMYWVGHRCLYWNVFSIFKVEIWGIQVFYRFPWFCDRVNRGLVIVLSWRHLTINK